MIDDGAYKVPGFSEAGAMKLLAVRFPEQFLPVFPYSGANGKAALMQPPELRLTPPPATGSSKGTLTVQANDLLYRRLAPFFPGDPWGMSRFLYWLRDRPATEPNGPKPDPLQELAEELLLDEAFLKQAIDLLREKRQLIFYGPPGTGKTYVARRLVEYLAPDPLGARSFSSTPATRTRTSSRATGRRRDPTAR